MSKEKLPSTSFRHLDGESVITATGTEIFSNDKKLAQVARDIFEAHVPFRLGSRMAPCENTHQGAVEAIILACGERCVQVDHYPGGDEEKSDISGYSDLVEEDVIQ